MPVARLNKSNSKWANLENVYKSTLANFVSSNNSGLVGIFDFSLAKFCEQVLQGYWTVPKYIAQDFYQRVPKHLKLYYRDFWPSLFWGVNGSYGSLHRDSAASEFWQYVIEGKKHWKILTRFSKLAELDLFSEPGLREWEGIVNPGEMIFIPGNCPHQVKNIGTTVAIAGNLISKYSFELMKREITGKHDANYKELQNALKQPYFDTYFNYSIEDIPWEEFKSPKLAPPAPATTPLFAWAQLHGVYIHPCVKYQHNGMFATCPIAPNTVLAQVPQDLHIPKNTPTHEILAEQLANRTVNSRFDVYIQSLPTTCQLPMCQPLNVTHLTLEGQSRMRAHLRRFETWSHAKKIAYSLVQSRTWPHGMIPILDLFNHNSKKASPIKKKGNTYLLKTSTEWTSPGDELFNNYGFKSQWYSYLDYGFVDNSITPTCDDTLLFRFKGYARLRTSCIANSSSTLQHMADELHSALAHGDLSMVKGAAQWLDKHIVFG